MLIIPRHLTELEYRITMEIFSDGSWNKTNKKSFIFIDWYKNIKSSLMLHHHNNIYNLYFHFENKVIYEQILYEKFFPWDSTELLKNKKKLWNIYIDMIRIIIIIIISDKYSLNFGLRSYNLFYDTKSSSISTCVKLNFEW